MIGKLDHTMLFLQTAGMQLVETYKGRRDKFAIFHGSLSSGSKLFVLQVRLKPPLFCKLVNSCSKGNDAFFV